jgi:threonine/homoserine/homoserine lactone efflux protein
MKWLVRGSIPIAAILVPAAFFLSVLSPNAKAPNGLIYLAYVVQMVWLEIDVLAMFGYAGGWVQGFLGPRLARAQHV